MTNVTQQVYQIIHQRIQRKEYKGIGYEIDSPLINTQNMD